MQFAYRSASCDKQISMETSMHAMQAITLPFAIAAVFGAILALVPTKSTNVGTDKILDYSLNIIQIASQDTNVTFRSRR